MDQGRSGLRIGIIGSRGLWSDYGGVERIITEVAQRLAARGHRVDTFADRDADRRRDIPGIWNLPTRSLRGKHTETISRSFLATLKCIGAGYDVLNYVAAGSGVLVPLGRLIGPATVVSLHGLDWERDKWCGAAKRFLRCGAQTAARFADEITVSSESQKDYFTQAFGRTPVFIPNGMPKAGGTDASLLADLGLKSRQYVLFAARLVPEKAAHELIAAFNRIPTPMKLVIAGENRHRPEYVSWLRRGTNAEKVLFVGHVSGTLLNTLFAEAYLFVNCSHVEGMSLALMEALAYRLPALVSDIVENRAVIDQYGFVFRAGDVDDLHRQLTVLLERPDMVRSMAGRMEEYLRKMLSWEKAAERLEDVFFRAIERRRAPPGARTSLTIGTPPQNV